MKNLFFALLVIWASVCFGSACPAAASAQELPNPPSMLCVQPNCRVCWEGKRQEVEAFRQQYENFRERGEVNKAAAERDRTRFEAERRNSSITHEFYREQMQKYFSAILSYGESMDNYYAGIEQYKKLVAAYRQGVAICQYQ